MGEESTKERGLGKTLERPLSVAPEQESCCFNTAPLQTKKTQSLEERSREKEEKRRESEKSTVENSHFFRIVLSPTVVVNMGSSVPAGEDGWGAAEARGPRRHVSQHRQPPGAGNETVPQK